MGRKKKESRERKDFHNSPFRTLKGLSVEAPATGAAKPSQKKKSAEKNSRGDDRDQFAREMEFLGVQPLEEGKAPVAEPPPAPEPREAAPASEREVFLAALGEMDAHFHDEYDAEESRSEPEPSRMRRVRRGQLLPEAQLDLHGLGREAAREKVAYFLDNALHHGQRTVLIITGRGNRSQDRPVLRTSVEEYLRQEGRGKVAEWGRAPQKLGGEGALVVFLRNSKLA